MKIHSNVKYFLDYLAQRFLIIFRSMAFILILIAAALGTGAAIVFPIWFLAVRFPDIYTFLSLFVLAAIIAVFIFIRIYTGIHQYQGLASYLRDRILPTIKKAGLVILFLGGFYGILILLLESAIWGFIALIAYILALGSIGYAGRRKKVSNRKTM